MAVSPYESGYIHGETLSREIDTIIARWEKVVERDFDTDFEIVIQSFFDKTTMVDTIKKYCPEILEEVKGIAEGAGQKYETVLALQMSEEIENAGDYLFAANCTSVSVSKTKEQPTIVGSKYGPATFFTRVSYLIAFQKERKSA